MLAAVGRPGEDEMLFEQAPKFKGLPAEGFDTFALADRTSRRRAIIETIHPALEALGKDLVERLSTRPSDSLHVHLPRLDWPRDYEPFCTWLALSRQAQGYQSGPQLNLGVHADHVTARLGWDTSSAWFARFEFLGRHGEIGEGLVAAASEAELLFRVYASAPWPRGSRCVIETRHDLPATFAEARQRGVWWELGRRYAIPASLPLVCSAEFGGEVASIFATLLPVYDRIAGESAGS
jgi:hypothetical protein